MGTRRGFPLDNPAVLLLLCHITRQDYGGSSDVRLIPMPNCLAEEDSPIKQKAAMDGGHSVVIYSRSGVRF